MTLKDAKNNRWHHGPYDTQTGARVVIDWENNKVNEGNSYFFNIFTTSVDSAPLTSASFWLRLVTGSKSIALKVRGYSSNDAIIRIIENFVPLTGTKYFNIRYFM